VSHFQTRADADGWLASPQRARPLISVVIVIPLMQYAVMPLLTRATRGILYPPRAPQLAGGAA
jgi:antibiotic biosynthesis monooxygenase (ABM) superfamily enzyme